MSVTEVTDATFEAEVRRAAGPVLVDYWADWCLPCKQMTPIIHELARHYGDRLKFCSVDTNANTVIPVRQGVMALPTIQIFRHGELVSSLQGGKTKGALVKAIEAALEG